MAQLEPAAPARSHGGADRPGEDGTRARVLVVDDDATIRELLDDLLTDEGYRVDTACDGHEALEVLDSRLYELVLLDINLPGPDGLTILGAAPRLQTDAQYVVMTAFGSVDTAVEAMKLGAFDYVTKPFQGEELVLVLERALEQLELRREVTQLRQRAEDRSHGALVGRTPPMKRLYQMIERVAPTRANVLVTGETGTGKELVAEAIHGASPRDRKPFVPVNCSALPDSLLESELFGHVKGAFTGAVQNRRGLIRDAQGGTLFLDEVGTISVGTQVKLLRVLQERTVKPVGGRESTPVDFRLVAASNRDLEEMVRNRDFREDLYYRLNVFPIRVPPLRERKDDIPLLASHFRRRFAQENEVEPPEIPPGTMKRMMGYDWPGNVRELENFVERSVIMHAGSATIPFEIDPVEEDADDAPRGMVEDAAERRWDLERLEREYILRVLDQTHWHKGNAAEILGINRRTLYRKLEKYREAGVLEDEG